MTEPRDIERRRRRRRISECAIDFPRQLDALRTAIGEFGADFDLGPFAAAYSSTDVELYKNVLIAERAFGHLQNYIAELVDLGVKLAGLEQRRHSGGEPRIAPALDALVMERVLSSELAKRIRKQQAIRNALEHAYGSLTPESVHDAIRVLAGIAPEFFESYLEWIDPWLNQTGGTDRRTD